LLPDTPSPFEWVYGSRSCCFLAASNRLVPFVDTTLDGGRKRPLKVRGCRPDVPPSPSEDGAIPFEPVPLLVALVVVEFELVVLPVVPGMAVVVEDGEAVDGIPMLFVAVEVTPGVGDDTDWVGVLGGVPVVAVDDEGVVSEGVWVWLVGVPWVGVTGGVPVGDETGVVGDIFAMGGVVVLPFVPTLPPNDGDGGVEAAPVRLLGLGLCAGIDGVLPTVPLFMPVLPREEGGVEG